MKYKEFITESINEHKYGCVMIDIPVNNWDEITSSINEDDIYLESEDGEPHGISKNPHCTILYGLHDNVSFDMVKSAFDGTDALEIEITGIGVFENKEYDVVKFNIVPNTSLSNLNKKLSEFPNSNEYPDFKPHITICYVKKGTGKQYINDKYHHIVKSNLITYSKADGKEYKFELK